LLLQQQVGISVDEFFFSGMSSAATGVNIVLNIFPASFMC